MAPTSSTGPEASSRRAFPVEHPLLGRDILLNAAVVSKSPFAKVTRQCELCCGSIVVYCSFSDNFQDGIHREDYFPHMGYVKPGTYDIINYSIYIHIIFEYDIFSFLSLLNFCTSLKWECNVLKMEKSILANRDKPSLCSTVE